jgi:hypothetical protein
MKKFGLSLVALVIMALIVPAAKADLVFNSTNGKCCFSVDLKQVNANDVLVTVTLSGGATLFANTGGGHPGFAFNLDKAITAANIQNATNLGTFHVGPFVTNGPAFGTFDYYFDIPGSGTSGNDAGPLTFDVVLSGVLLSDFSKNTAGYYFAADILDAAGGTGTSAISTDPTNEELPSVPEPASLMLLGSGLSAAALRLRKRNK